MSTNKRKKGNPVSKLIVNNVKITKGKGIANTLNKHFTNIGKNLSEKIIPKENFTFKTYLTDSITHPHDGILKEIDQLKTKATLDIMVSLLKHVKQAIVNGSVIIFYKSFEERRFSEMLKIAKVIPIFKGENPTDPKRNQFLFKVQLYGRIYSIT